MAGEIKAIETRYKGYRFRSRLEARWAVYFDACPLLWEYEKQGFDLGNGVFYLPDFWLPQVRMWAEVKPEQFSPIELDKVRRLVVAIGFKCLLLTGVPSYVSYWAIEGDGPDDCCDYVVSNYHNYPDDERRFYGCTGNADTGHRDNLIPPSLEGLGFEDDVVPAVMAARSARFEHGETPRF
jgi:hypothetical protein